jgi:hypothetical protein
MLPGANGMDWIGSIMRFNYCPGQFPGLILSPNPHLAEKIESMEKNPHEKAGSKSGGLCVAANLTLFKDLAVEMVKVRTA